MRVPGNKLCLQKLADELEVQWEYCKSRGQLPYLGLFLGSRNSRSVPISVLELITNR